MPPVQLVQPVRRAQRVLRVLRGASAPPALLGQWVQLGKQVHQALRECRVFKALLVRRGLREYRAP